MIGTGMSEIVGSRVSTSLLLTLLVTGGRGGDGLFHFWDSSGASIV